jgi:hypothetical protein
MCHFNVRCYMYFTLSWSRRGSIIAGNFQPLPSKVFVLIVIFTREQLVYQ